MELHRHYGSIHCIGCVFYSLSLAVTETVACSRLSPWLVAATWQPPQSFFFFLSSGPLRPPPNSHRTAQVAPLPGVWASDCICTIGLTLKLVWLELGVNHFLWTTSHSLTPVLLYSHLLGWINVQTQVNCAQSIWEQWERLFRWFSVCLFVCLSGSEFSHCTQSLD